MRTKSHRQLGIYLSDRFLAQATTAERTAFLFGCMEPDWNPATYLKGSFDYQRLRGHNFSNAKDCIRHLSEELKNDAPGGVLYYYRMGKLTHYITDAFTYPHNDAFSGTLREHIQYEQILQEKFLNALRTQGQTQDGCVRGELFHWILEEHRMYLDTPAAMENDIHFAVEATAAAVRRLHVTIPAEVHQLPAGGAL